MDAAMSAEVLRERGLGDLEGRLQRLWVEAAEAALARNDVSFAMLPMDRVLDPQGFLAPLAARGYLVEAPAEDQLEVTDSQ
jgi:hypothetical protein